MIVRDTSKQSGEWVTCLNECVHFDGGLRRDATPEEEVYFSESKDCDFDFGAWSSFWDDKVYHDGRKQ